MAHLDAEAFGLRAVRVVGTLLPALEARCGRLTHTVPYSRWREVLRSTGGAEEAALAVLPLPTSAEDGEKLRLPRGKRAGLQRARGKALAAAGGVVEPDLNSEAGMWSQWADKLVSSEQHQQLGDGGRRATVRAGNGAVMSAASES